jgi:NADPH:quinone reductase-like Zn-dependent oxidoreductase
VNQYGIKAIFVFSQVNRQWLTKLAQWVDQNNIKVYIDKTFALDEAGKALDYQKWCTSKWQCSLDHLTL